MAITGGYFRIREGWLPCVALVATERAYTALKLCTPTPPLSFWAGAPPPLGPSLYYYAERREVLDESAEQVHHPGMH